MIIPLTVGPLMTSCYILTDPTTGEAAVVDPGADADLILRELDQQQQAPLTAILCTHGHPDHVGAVQTLVTETGVSEVYMHPDELPALADYALPELGEVRLPQLRAYGEGDHIEIGQLVVRILHTPGHSPGSVCLAVDSENVLLTGDLIFAGGVGRTDLPGGSLSVLQASLRRIINEFPENTALYPGHGPQTTLAAELRSNPWLVELA